MKENIEIIKFDKLHEACLLLKEKQEFNFLMDICAVDYIDEDKIEVVYHLYSLKKAKRIRVKVSLPREKPIIASVSDIWKAANWFEREIFDLFGVDFLDHPNLKRILTYEGFEGHALRKDYPKNKRQHIPKPDRLI